MSDTENKVNLSTFKKEMKDVLPRLVKTMSAYFICSVAVSVCGYVFVVIIHGVQPPYE